MTSNYKCPYARECQDYTHGSIKCCFAYKFCKQKKEFEERRKLGIENKLLDLQDKR